jgi:hypothetical protein
MFRWVALSLEAFSKSNSDLTLSKGCRTAVATLNWLLCAQCLMKTYEIIAVVSVELHEVSLTQPYSDEVSSGEDMSVEDFEDYSQYELVSCNDIIQLCRNLV